MMRRREFLTLISTAAAGWSLEARGQRHQNKIPVVGVLWPGSSPANISRMNAFRQSLHELGYVEGQNISVATIGVEPSSSPTQLVALAKELARANVEVIVTAGTSPTEAAKTATAGAIPIVMTFVSDPVGSGFVTSLPHPGGNITGLSNFGPEMAGKWLELIKDLSPKAAQVGVLYDSAVRVLVGELERAAKVLDVDLSMVEANDGELLEAALTKLLAKQLDALIVTLPPRFPDYVKRITTLSAANRLATVYWWREYIDDGGLVYYGPNITEMYRRAAIFVKKILNGERPAELPVEQPTKFDLVINARAAKAIALPLSATLLARADEVIE